MGCGQMNGWISCSNVCLNKRIGWLVFWNKWLHCFGEKTGIFTCKNNGILEEDGTVDAHEFREW